VDTYYREHEAKRIWEEGRGGGGSTSEEVLERRKENGLVSIKQHAERK
jgi:hypothetical protein